MEIISAVGCHLGNNPQSLQPISGDGADTVYSTSSECVDCPLYDSVTYSNSNNTLAHIHYLKARTRSLFERVS